MTDEIVVLRFEPTTAAQLRDNGLVMNVRVASGALAVPTTAIVDTGADTTCVSREVARALGMSSKATEKHHVINGGYVDLEIGECAIDLSGYGTWEVKHAGIVDMGEAHQVILGRDLLAHAKLLVNFVDGRWEMHLPSRLLHNVP